MLNMTIDDINRALSCRLEEERKEEDYRKYLEEFLSKYLDMVSAISADAQKSELPEGFVLDELLKELSSTNYALLDAYTKYSEGKVASAIRIMCERFMTPGAVRTMKISSSDDWYRVRTKERRGSGFLPKEMFHIPFSKRTEVVNYRYSISGYPCLYLGNTILTCWEEMSCPALDDIVVSRVKLNKAESLPVLDLRMPKLLNEKPLFYDKPEDEVKSDNLQLLKTWPLIIACSIKTITPESSFKHEYVHPQLLMLALRESMSDMYGVAYTSTHIDKNIDDSALSYTNVAIPVRKVQATGYCQDLAAKFSLTRGVSFMEADLKNVFGPEYDEDDEVLNFSNIKFNQLEKYLGNIELEVIKDN